MTELSQITQTYKKLYGAKWRFYFTKHYWKLYEKGSPIPKIIKLKRHHNGTLCNKKFFK